MCLLSTVAKKYVQEFVLLNNQLSGELNIIWSLLFKIEKNKYSKLKKMYKIEMLRIVVFIGPDQYDQVSCEFKVNWMSQTCSTFEWGKITNVDTSMCINLLLIYI